MTKLIEIAGIGDKHASALERVGIGTVENLLEEGNSAAGIARISRSTGITAKDIRRWVNVADLVRIAGLEHTELLEAAGVDTVRELATRNAGNLRTELEEVNADKRLVRRTPTSKEVERWIAEAKQVSLGRPDITKEDQESRQSVIEPPLTADPDKTETFDLTRAVLDLISEAATIFGTTDDAIAWLNAPNRSLGGIAPRELFEKGIEGVDEAAAVLFRLEEGIYS